ncbi:Smr/MutS family protein [Phenylobacterium sp. J367]|nr:Smr/MutS family protein [Phenylobacterium sp. J367]
MESFLARAWNDGYRAVLVITGKGVQGDGILRRRTPEWLAAPPPAPHRRRHLRGRPPPRRGRGPVRGAEAQAAGLRPTGFRKIRVARGPPRRRRAGSASGRS